MTTLIALFGAIALFPVLIKVLADLEGRVGRTVDDRKKRRATSTP